MRVLPAIALALVASAVCARAQNGAPTPLAANPRVTGIPFHQVWTNDDYGGAPENRCVLQHPATHFIYVGNDAGMLEYDGVTWRLTRLPDGGPVYALAVDRRGRIWANTVAALWRLEASPDNGEWRAISMTERLPPAEPNHRGVHFIPVADGMYFATQTKLHFFPDDDTKPVRTVPWPPGRLQKMWWMDGALHGALLDGTFVRLREDGFQRVGGPFVDFFPYLALPASPRQGHGWILLTYGGPALWAGNQRRPVRLGSNELGLSRPYRAKDAVVLSDGRFAFATSRHGVAIYDSAGRIVERLDRDRGLPANDIEAIAEDFEGGLWVAQRSRIIRLQLDSPFALHGGARDLHGEPHVIQRRNDRLYVGHSEGLSWRDEAGRFHSVADAGAGVVQLFERDDRLYAVGRNFFAISPDDRAELKIRQAFFGLAPLRRDPEVIAAGAPGGLLLFRVVGENWRAEGRVQGVSGFAGRMTPMSDGTLWIWSRDRGMQRIDLRQSVTAPAIRTYGLAEGVPPEAHAGDDVTVFNLGGTVGLRIGGRLIRLDERSDRFVPEERIQGFPGGAGIRKVYPQPNGELWIVSEAESLWLARIVPHGSAPWHAQPLEHPVLRNFNLETLSDDTVTRTVWLGGSRTLLSFDRDWRPIRPMPPMRPSVRRIATLDGRSLSPVARSLVLSPQQNAIRMTFGAPSFVPGPNGRSSVEFRTRLAGLESGWTEWSTQSQREFTSLPFRDFALHLQARSTDGRVSPDLAGGVLAFSVAPPWWLTRWAYLGYGVTVLLGIGGVVGLRTRVLHERAARLEREVVERTGQLQERNRELARLHQLELDEKAAARLAEEKARLELLRYQLNPHFLYNALNSIYGQIHSKPGAAAEMVVRIADFCRATLTRSSDALQTVDEELKIITSYLTVEKARWGDDLLVEIEADATTRERVLPSFVLLPLVENAVKYGSVTNPGVLQVRVMARLVADDTLELEVANTGQWITPGTAAEVLPGVPSTGIGYENLHLRLQRYYPGRHALTHDAADGWVRVKLSLASLHSPPVNAAAGKSAS